MPHTYCDHLFHVVFSTKDRRRQTIDRMEHVHRYMGGIAKKNGFSAVKIGGTEDHVHLLLALPTTIPVAKAVQLIKGGSSKWFNEEYPGSGFGWQEGFASFSVSRSMAATVVEYISNQAEHHRKRDFAAEFVGLLKKHGIEFDSKYVLDEPSLRDSVDVATVTQD